MSIVHRSHPIAGLIGGLVLALAIALAGPASAAQAAWNPDMQGLIWPDTTDLRPGQASAIWAIGANQNPSGGDGPIEVIVMLAPEFQAVQLADNGGYACSGSYSKGGYLPGWGYKCTRGSAKGSPMTFRFKAPAARGEYGIYVQANPVGVPDANPNNNGSRMVFRVN